MCPMSYLVQTDAPLHFRVNILLEELQKEQAANERGACLEALSAIMER